MLDTSPLALAQALIRCPSVTPEEGGALSFIAQVLGDAGFEVHRPVFSAEGTPDVENLYARFGVGHPHLVFAGHTDVVPPGDAARWRHDPFGGIVEGGELFGRGATDMKGGVACMMAAALAYLADHPDFSGSIGFLITGDEEGPAVNGTVKLLDWAKAKGERFDHCILGEPTNPEALGDMIKIGRRGSLSGRITVHGVQGHAAYPHLADNPVRGMLQLTHALMDPPFDGGTDDFQPSNLEVTTVDVGNPATNVIPAKASASFNIRFNDSWTVETLRAEILRRLDAAARDGALRPGRDPVKYDIVWADRPSHVFLTRNNALIASLSSAVESISGQSPRLSTTGGTSDARFIKDYCPVVEFGLVGQTMHMVDERVAVADLETLTAIYETFIAHWFANAGL
ncbi:MAG: succinyl-diaminopimelate desuccinylase [Bradyrhizobium canariense]